MNRVLLLSLCLATVLSSSLQLQQPLLIAGGPAVSQFSTTLESLVSSMTASQVTVYRVASSLSNQQMHQQTIDALDHSSAKYGFYSQYMAYQPEELIALLSTNSLLPQVTQEALPLERLSALPAPLAGQIVIVTFEKQGTQQQYFRMLEDEESHQTEAKATPLGITGIVLSGYLVSLFCLTILLIGGCCLFNL